MIRGYYVDPDKIGIEKVEDEDIDLEVEYFPESEVEESQAAQNHDDVILQEEMIPETQT